MSPIIIYRLKLACLLITMNNYKEKFLSGSAIMVSVVIMAAIFLAAFGSAYMVITSTSREAKISETLKAEQSAFAGVERLKFEVYSNNFDASSATCGSDIFSFSNDDGSSYSVYCLDVNGEKKFYSSGFYNGREFSREVRIPFVCGRNIEYEGQSYRTVKIGSQCWMKDNLNVGTQISTVDKQGNDGVVEKYCYGSSKLNCDVYGGLYEWPEAMKYSATEGARGICPYGWHIPTDSEIKQLEMFLGMTQTMANYPTTNGSPVNRGTNEGGELKSTTTYNGTTIINHPRWDQPNTLATDTSSFSALPAGAYWVTFRGIGQRFYMWSSSLGTSWPYLQWNRFLDYSMGTVGRINRFHNSYIAYSIRCIKD